MSFQLPNTRQVSSSEQVSFHCKHCGACCRHLRESVPLNTLDAYRLAKYLRGRGQSVTCLDEIFVRYAEPVPLDKSGYTVYMLKTTGPDDTCIFLKDKRCTIQQAKPTACRLYPFVAEPTTDGGCKFLLSMERRHHFKGGQVQAGRWMKKYFSPEDREFMRIDIGSAPVIALLMRKVPALEQKRAIMQYLWYRFSDFDLDRPLVEQYRQNTLKLVAALKEMQEVSP
ncbi:YkgJ family cysteine cluster protein [Acutalibacter intestini]|uniref:YkgJ family cysteine cluster protein n=1 Tax=Acutalibacter intestini TaxID=3093659 RepID=UPI002AC9404C|nr:YkgJ family cysteine cluster protein [Acutalibacter sp. M00204]